MARAQQTVLGYMRPGNTTPGMAENGDDIKALSDDELVERYRQLKAEAGGDDPRLSPPDQAWDSAVREEMERRGLTPDREDIIPDSESPDEDPIVEDHA